MQDLSQAFTVKSELIALQPSLFYSICADNSEINCCVSVSFLYKSTEYQPKKILLGMFWILFMRIIFFSRPKKSKVKKNHLKWATDYFMQVVFTYRENHGFYIFYIQRPKCKFFRKIGRWSHGSICDREEAMTRQQTGDPSHCGSKCGDGIDGAQNSSRCRLHHSDSRTCILTDCGWCWKEYEEDSTLCFLGRLVVYYKL